MAMIEVDNLSVTFNSGDRKVEALKNVSFRVERGEVYGLVGESGSGKSTVLRALSGLVKEISGGGMTVDGNPLGRTRPNLFHQQVQMVFQDPYGSLHPRHTVDTTLVEPLKINRFDRQNERIEKALNDVGLRHSFRFRYPHQLSGGQRQRVAIARAIILQPRILLLDEPTSALDVSVQAEILNLLRHLKEELGLTMIFVSHNLKIIGHLCDRMSVMNKGEVVEELTVDQLRKKEVSNPYTVQLLTAAEGYDRELVKSFGE